MKRGSESFSPMEEVKQSRTKVMQSEIKEADSRCALHLFFSFWLILEACCCSVLFANSLFCVTRSN